MQKPTALKRLNVPIHLEFFSPSPVGRPAHLMDTAAVKLLNRFHAQITASWRAVPAPDHINRTDHLRVFRTAVFSAEQVVFSRLSRFEPGRSIATWEHIHLHPESGYIKAVNDIF